MRTQIDVIEPEWEVLPPEENEKRARLEPLFRWVAIVMDELIAFPNTKFKFGLDPLIGLVPGIGDTGDAFSFWFKSNKRNYQLLLAHTATPRRARASDWVFVIAVLAILFVVVATGIFVSLLVLRAIAQLLGLH
ncbi:MAG: hypothetical protein DME40_06150 [Verrucomicrobia bacterium]|nr:MAG: hypothetical protein DME40_06150 [Verrucomicrobiota bacterium]